MPSIDVEREPDSNTYCTLPETVQEEIAALGDDSWDDQVRAWRRILTIGRLWAMYPPSRHPTQEHREMVSLISQVARRRRASQAAYSRIYQTLRQGEQATGALSIPRSIDWSTARYIVEHGGDWQTLTRADAESWTLAQARLKMSTATRETTAKPQTLWHHLTRVIPAEIRRATGPVDERATLQALRDALRDWQEQIRGEQT